MLSAIGVTGEEESFVSFLGSMEAPKAYLLWSIDGELRKLYEEDICI